MTITVDGKEMKIDLEKAKALGIIWEHVDEFKAKRLSIDSVYYHVGLISDFTIEGGQDNDQIRFDAGNYFGSQKQADAMLKCMDDIWFKIKAWSIRTNTASRIGAWDVKYYVGFNDFKGQWYSSFHKISRSGQIFMGKADAEKLVKILNENRYTPDSH
jgi:hypothetical protein